MNERIRLLAEQAEEYAKHTVHYYMGQFDGLVWETKFKNTRDSKFAELIVRECLDIVNRKEYSYYEADPLWETAELIREHFGVEE